METILKVENLTVAFQINGAEYIAINNISFNLMEGEILAIAGESSSGKTLTALSILNLIEYPGYIKTGNIIYKEQNLLLLPKTTLENIRGKEISMIFQEPSTAFDNFFTIRYHFYEILQHHLKLDKQNAKTTALNWLNKLNFSNPEIILNSYPFQLSGGMQQRLMIALALCLNPTILIADEPTSSLDVITQNTILKMILSLKNELNISILLISHDFGVIMQFATNVAIMYKGRILEYATKYELFNFPLHPYTKYLLSNITDFKTNMLPNKLQHYNHCSLEYAAQGCPFYPHCNYKKNICSTQFPQPYSHSTSHNVYCWLFKGSGLGI